MARNRSKFLLKWALIALGLIITYLVVFEFIIDKRPAVEWTLIKADSGQTQAESQLVKLPNGQVLLFNAGEASGSLMFHLKKQKIKDIDYLLLSSYQPAAISGISDILKKGTRIKQVFYNPSSAESPSWIEIKQKFLREGVKTTPLESGKVIISQAITQLQILALEKNSLVLRLVHGKNSLAVGIGSPSGLGHQLSRLNCDLLRTEVLFNYTEIETKEPYLDWVGCLKPVYDLSSEKGTFKILFKGDSFKLKRR